MNLDNMSIGELCHMAEMSSETLNIVNSAYVQTVGLERNYSDMGEAGGIIALEAICSMVPGQWSGMEGLDFKGYAKAAKDKLIKWAKAVLKFLQDIFKRIMGLFKKKPKPDDKAVDPAVEAMRAIPCDHYTTMVKTNRLPGSTVHYLRKNLQARMPAIIDLLDVSGIRDGETIDKGVASDAFNKLLMDLIVDSDDETKAEQERIANCNVGGILLLYGAKDGSNMGRFTTERMENAGRMYIDNQSNLYVATINSTSLSDELREMDRDIEKLLGALTGFGKNYDKYISKLEKGEEFTKIPEDIYKGVVNLYSDMAVVTKVMDQWRDLVYKVYTQQLNAILSAG